MNQVSCIIPVYNEKPRIGGVLEVVSGHPGLQEIIVVDDGSTDGTTGVVVKNFPRVKLIVHEKNQGKTQALITGLKAASNELVFFLDADLVGLKQENIDKMLEPVLAGRADLTISLRQNSPWIDRMLGLDFISGDRVLPRQLIFNHLAEIGRLPKFGFESYLNKLIIQNKLKIKVVFWKGVRSPWKYEKSGLLKGVKSDILMLADILRTIPPWEVVYQFVKMISLRVK